MSKQFQNIQIDAMDAAQAVNTTLRQIDNRLVDHGERVAYITYRLCKTGGLSFDLKTLYLLCIFHDIGAYKTDEIDQMLEFETTDVLKHSAYGYLFLKYMTPIKDYAKAVLYHHSSQKLINEKQVKHGDYASLLHLADRIDVLYTYHSKDLSFQSIYDNSKGLFHPEYVSIAKQCIEKENLISMLQDQTYKQENQTLLSSFATSASEAFEYLKMIIYAIDFRSEHTVTHTINTVSLAVDIGKHFNLPEEELDNLYLGALLHDVGKIAIPLSILESSGKLSEEQMVIMRTHVDETEKIIHNVIPSYICELALRHHEKLDGSGYPKGLDAKDLTFSQRIIAVADIVSALSTRRSYKEPFPKEKTLAILDQLQGNKLDGDICSYVCENYDAILNNTEPDRIMVIDKYQQMMEEYKKLVMSE